MQAYLGIAPLTLALSPEGRGDMIRACLKYSHNHRAVPSPLWGEG